MGEGKKSWNYVCDPVAACLDRHLLLPGQQDSGPGATFPYHYQDEARSPPSPSWLLQRCTTDLQNSGKKLHDGDQIFDDIGMSQTVNHSPILTSLLAAEPTSKQKHATFPGTYYSALPNKPWDTASFIPNTRKFRWKIWLKNRGCSYHF